MSPRISSGSEIAFLGEGVVGDLAARPGWIHQMAIVQALHDIQSRCGYLAEEELKELSERQGIPLRRLHEVATFFPHFRMEPPAPVEVQVCRDMPCHLRGARELRLDLESVAAQIDGRRVEVSGVSCLGQCDAAPAVVIGPHVYRGKTTDQFRQLVRQTVVGLDDPESRPEPQLADRSPLDWAIDPYNGREEYQAVRNLVASPDAESLLGALRESTLRGMGGAGVPAHQKWADVRQARGDEKYIVCNADESEPATFKDREILLRAPHLVIEGVILAGLVTGAKRGYIYIRHEYEEPIETVRQAIEHARALGVCGENILGTGRSFPVEIFVSPGGYICGEQSALIEAMEDRRAEPRNKPPQLETNGLFDKPTLVSNVETFGWAPSIALRGGAWYRDQGINGCKGMRFFSICGDVNNPGVFEVPIGLKLRELIEDRAGGLRGGQTLKAIAPSGPSGGFLPPLIRLRDGSELDVLDLPLDLDVFRKYGLMLGAGLVVYGDRADMVDQAQNASEFFRNESCGKCVPCRNGSERFVEIGSQLLEGRFDRTLIKSASELTSALQRTLELTSICGLGMVAGAPLSSVLRGFRGDVDRYLRQGAPDAAEESA
jgi:NADH:ubiquinone oxidoreductase subunit F (NADH-binding)/NADH:ubiquinone oxidoreductase subunit E